MSFYDLEFVYCNNLRRLVLDSEERKSLTKETFSIVWKASIKTDKICTLSPYCFHIKSSFCIQIYKIKYYNLRVKSTMIS